MTFFLELSICPISNSCHISYEIVHNQKVFIFQKNNIEMGFYASFASSIKKIDILIIALIILIAIILAITFFLIKKKKTSKEKKLIKSGSKYLRKIEKIKSGKLSNEKKLHSLGETARRFFGEYLKINSNATYEELKALLENKRKAKMAEFCSKISYYLYSGAEIKKEELESLFKDFEGMI